MRPLTLTSSLTRRETWWNFAISTPTYQNSDIAVVLITPHVSKIKCEELVFHAVLPWHRGDVSSMLKMEVPTPKFSLAKIIYPIVKEPRSVGFSCIFHLIGTPYIIAHPIYFRKRNFGTFLVEDTGLEPVVACLQSRCSCRCANPPCELPRH